MDITSLLREVYIKKFILLMILGSFSNFASANVLCNISNLSEARKCMKRVAISLPEYELKNEGFASEGKHNLNKALKALGAKEATFSILADAHFVGFVLSHEDEHRIIYYGLKLGKLSRPFVIYDLNVVDLSYDLKAKITINNVFLGIEVKKLDVYDEVLYSLNNLEN